MYLDFEVKIPEVPGKIGRFTKGGTTYVRYVTGRTYHPEKKYNIPNHKTIGKQSFTDQTMMIPNENYLKYFGKETNPTLEIKACEYKVTRRHQQRFLQGEA